MLVLLANLSHLLGRADAGRDLLVVLLGAGRLAGRRAVAGVELLVALAGRLVVLLDDEVGLHAQHPGDADEREQDEDRLKIGLAGVELVLGLDRARREEHVDEHVEQARRRDEAGLRPVDAPLVDDADDEVAKDRLHEQDLGHELGVDRPVVLEAEVVRDLQADGERHLWRAGREGGSVGKAARRRGKGRARRTWMTPRMMLIFILYELVKTSALSVPCQAGSRPNG